MKNRSIAMPEYLEVRHGEHGFVAYDLSIKIVRFANDKIQHLKRAYDNVFVEMTKAEYRAFCKSKKEKARI